MKRIRVLFVCVNNSARSQMAEAFLNAMAGDKYEAAPRRYQVEDRGLPPRQRIGSL